MCPWVPLGSSPSAPASPGRSGRGRDCDQVSFPPAICLKSALFAKILFCWSLFLWIKGVACEWAIPSGHHTPKPAGRGRAGDDGWCSGKQPDGLGLPGERAKIQRDVPAGGAGIDFVSPRAELLRTKEHFIYFPQKSITYSFYFSDCKNSPCPQACVRSAQSDPCLSLASGGDEDGNPRCVPPDVLLFQSTREGAGQQMQPVTWESPSRNRLARSCHVLGKRHRLQKLLLYNLSKLPPCCRKPFFLPRQGGI